MNIIFFKANQRYLKWFTFNLCIIICGLFFKDHCLNLHTLNHNVIMKRLFSEFCAM